MRPSRGISEAVVWTAVLACASASIAAAVPLDGTTWFPIGPAPILYYKASSGRATAAAVNPANDDDIWLGTAGGGVWHSTNGGANWQPTSDNESSLAIGAVALDGCDQAGCTSIYAGTGENGIRRDTYYGRGLLLGHPFGPGFVWTLLGGAQFNFGAINNVLLDPNTSGSTKRIFVTVSSGATASATESTVTSPIPPGGYGIYRSDDNGNTWTRLFILGADGLRPTDLKMDPGDSHVLYAGYLGENGLGAVIFKSLDGGDTWCPLSPGVAGPGCPFISGLPNPFFTTYDRVTLAIAPSRHTTLYALYGDCPDPLYASCTPAIYKSTDGGTTWLETHVPDPGKTDTLDQDCPNVYGRYTHGLAVDPTTPESLYVGGLALCKSTDSGTTYSELPANQGSDPLHLDHHAILFGSDASRVYDLNDGGIATSADGGATWTARSTDLQVTGFQSIATSPLTKMVVAASQDNGTEIWLGGRAWMHAYDDDGGFTILDRSDALTVFTSSQIGEVLRSVDGGNTWTELKYAPGFPELFVEPRAFYTPVVQDSTFPYPLYYGTNRLYGSTDRGSSWTNISPTLSTSDQQEIWHHKNVITAIAVAPSDPTRVYVGLYGGEIFSIDGPNAACPVAGCPACRCSTSIGGAGKGLPQAPVAWLAVDSTNRDVAYAAFSGFGANHLFKTTDAGNTWTAKVNGLPVGVPANVVAVEPSTPVRLWLGTDQGVFKSLDGGDTWTRFSDGLPNVPVYQISLDETHGRVYAATHGRGAYVLSGAFLGSFDGCTMGGVTNLHVHGYGFPPNANCTLRLLRADGTECTSGTTDTRGATILTDNNGTLSTSKPSYFNGQPVAVACTGGVCIGGVQVNACFPMSTVEAICGGVAAFDHIAGCPALGNPPSTLLGFTPPSTAGIAAAMEITPSVQSGDGSTRSLCTVKVPFFSTEAPADVAVSARDAVNGSPTCAGATVAASVQGLAPAGEEDAVDTPALAITAPGVSGGQLYTSVHLAPGLAPGAYFDLGALGVVAIDESQAPRIQFETPGTGAAGGQVRIVERSFLGTCEIPVPTTPGESASQIAQAVEAAFQAYGIPGPWPACPADQNPRDVVRTPDDPVAGPSRSVVTAMAVGLTVCVEDAGVGVTLRPEEMVAAHPAADAGGDRTVCVGSAGAAVTLDGSRSVDPDSTPGTNDDIVAFDWFEYYGLAGQQILLGSGEIVGAYLSPGNHAITLRVTDRTGLIDVQTVTVAVAALAPAEIGGLVVASDAQTLSWSPTGSASGGGVVYDLWREPTAPVPVGSESGGVCLASSVTAATFADPVTPFIASGFRYLVRGRNACGGGPWGQSSFGSPETPGPCP
jgi:photosystem II stability/assembly factor-like uncharacterized protein